MHSILMSLRWIVWFDKGLHFRIILTCMYCYTLDNEAMKWRKKSKLNSIKFITRIDLKITELQIDINNKTDSDKTNKNSKTKGFFLHR